VVKSFYIPYFCSECDQEKVMLTEASELGPPPHQPPVCRCDECDLVMEFDDMADSYFAFLAHQPEVDLGELGAAIERGGDASSERIRTRASSVPAPVSSGVSLPSIPSLPTGSAIAGLSPAAPPPPSNPPVVQARPLRPDTGGSPVGIIAAIVVGVALIAAVVLALTS
jgi:hypothetical protein